MNCLSHVRAYGSTIFRKAGHFVATSTLNHCHFPLWKTNFEYAGVKTVDLEFLLTRFRAQCYSSRKSSGSKKVTTKSDSEPVMDPEKDAFFLVRKGDIVGVYKSFAECQAQVGSSICDPPVSVFKGYSLTKDSEEYLASSGLKNALYTIKAADVKEDLFGTLTPCTFLEPASSKGETSRTDAAKKRSQDAVESNIVGLGALSSAAVADPPRKHVKLDPHAEAQLASSDHRSCILEFDGASKGNPGPAGAGAVLKTDAGNLICKLREGLGTATNNAAEYRALILGLNHAIRKGYTKIRVRGDSKLVCMQLRGLWKVKHEQMSEFYKQAKKLKSSFRSFQIEHVLREFNKDADAEANLAVELAADVADISTPDDLVYSDPPASTTVNPVLPNLLQPRVVIYDGVCHLCHGGVKWVIKADKHRKIKFCCLQSKAAEPYLSICGVDREDVLRRFVFIEGLGVYHQGSTAALRVLSYLPLPYSALSAFLIIPTPLRDAVYDYVAKRRYNWFGKSEDCLVLQDKELLERFIDREELMDRSRSNL
ncbi:putative thiol-disulfide oxidoreductase DCC protein [Corchorus olitorius]|uniref:Thiol-disulfide oxidoreductase DCC protein n=1 Tax=Corchorus olitorius TaxID=93759 RepID=A0A1R3FY48_9ROSI|nr:putative thiol-disulfide oxidoreductase DCC protein [Corchorus olitorius]